MQQNCKEKQSQIITFRRANNNDDVFEGIESKIDILQNTKAKMYTQCQTTPSKPQKRMSTQVKSNQIIIRNANFRITHHRFQKQDLKEQFFLINLCKNLQTKAFKLKNPTLEIWNFRQNDKKALSIHTQNRKNQFPQKEWKTPKLNASLNHQNRKALKQRLKTLQKTLPNFGTHL